VAKKPCQGKFGNCAALVKIGEKYCPDCQPREKQREQAKTREYDQKRGSSAQRGYNAHWQKVRLRKLKKDPLCQSCDSFPVFRKADLVHHIDGNPKNNAMENLMSVCNACHEKIHKNDRWGRSVR
jgi:5-methylcytosine-specific restriction protein A